MEYKIGDKIPDGEPMLRRIKLEWINGDKTISREAFRPRMYRSKLEDGVSVDMERYLTRPVGDDYWSNERGMATGRILSQIINTLTRYEIVHNGPSPSHCIITGDMAALNSDEASLDILAESTQLIHEPED